MGAGACVDSIGVQLLAMSACTCHAQRERRMKYPGRIIKAGEADARIVKALKTALNKALALRGGEAIVLDADNPTFGPRMKQAVQLFQVRHVDEQGQPLKTDGEVGITERLLPRVLNIRPAHKFKSTVRLRKRQEIRPGNISSIENSSKSHDV